MTISGARQTGKSTLIREEFSQFACISLDLPSVAELAESRPEAFLAQHPPPCAIDEIQYAPKLFRYLKVMIDQNRQVKGRYLLTGSQKFHLMTGVADSLAGRVAVCELETLSYREVLAHRTPTISEFLLRGGYPELWSDSRMNHVEFYRGYLSTYLERDVRQLLQVKNLRDFERFVRVLATRSGQLINKTEISKDIGVAVTTISNWLSVLEASNQIFLLEPYYRNIGKRIVKTPKIYFNDTGLLCFLLGLTIDNLQTGAIAGHIFETFVVGQVRRFLQTRSDPASLWFYRDRRGLEVDLVIEYQGRLIPIEVKQTEVPTKRDIANLKKFRALNSAAKLEPGYLACATKQTYLIDDVSVIPAASFDGWLD